MTGGILSGLRKHEVEARQDEIIAFAELENFIDQPVRSYSTGMYVRLAFSSAIHLDPEILVIDEVLAVGDTRFQRKCIDRLKEFHKKGKTLILTSHDFEQIRTLCDEVMVLEEGKVVMQGDPEAGISCYRDLMKQRTEKQAAKVSSDNSGSIQVERGSRLGTMEASIETVRIKKAKGNDVESFQSNDSIVFELELRINPSVKDAIFVLGIYTDTNLKCFEEAIESIRDSFGNFFRSGLLRCQFPSLPLIPGNYFLNLGLYPSDRAYAYDYHWQMHVFQIEGREHSLFRKTSGIVALNPKWTISTINSNINSSV